MKIIRATKSLALSYLEPHLLESYSMSKENLLEFMKMTLDSGSPEGSLTLMAFDGDVLKAFLIAFDEPGTDHVFVLQVWADKDLKEKIVQKQMFFRLCMWVESVGKTIIRGETVRNSDAFFRAWGFKKTSEIVSFEIPSDFEIETIDRLVEANRNDKPETVTSTEKPHGPDDELVGDAEPSDGGPIAESPGSPGLAESEKQAPSPDSAARAGALKIARDVATSKGQAIEADGRGRSGQGDGTVGPDKN